MPLISVSLVSADAIWALRPWIAPLERTSGEYSPPVLRCRVEVSTRSACALASWRDQREVAGVFLVETFIADDDALGLLELRHLGLRLLEIGPHCLPLLIEEGRRLPGRSDPKLDRDIHVGLREGVGGSLHEDRVGSGKTEVDDVAAAQGFGPQPAREHAGEVALEGDLGVGGLAPLGNGGGGALNSQDLHRPRGDPLAPDDLDLGRHVVGCCQGRGQRTEGRVDPHFDDQRRLCRVLLGQVHRDDAAGNADDDEQRQDEPFAGPDDSKILA